MVHTYPRTELCGSLAYHYDATTKQRIAETIAQQIPALSLYLPPEQSPSTESPSSGAQRTSTINALELVLPATGCPEKLPTYRSLAHACKPLDEKTCNENRLCTWSRTNQCSAKSGSYVPAPDIDPAVAARLGLAYVDNFPSGFRQERKQVGTDCNEYPFMEWKNYLENRQFDRAIAEFTKLLVQQPDLPEALSVRARAYELRGDKALAIRDYCRIIVIFAKRLLWRLWEVGLLVPRLPLSSALRSRAASRLSQGASEKMELRRSRWKLRRERII